MAASVNTSSISDATVTSGSLFATSSRRLVTILAKRSPETERISGAWNTDPAKPYPIKATLVIQTLVYAARAGKWQRIKGLHCFWFCAILSLAFETQYVRLNLNETTSLDRFNRTRREFQR